MVGHQFQLSHALAAAFCLPCSPSLLFAARQTIISDTKYISEPCKNLPNSSDSQTGMDSAYGFIQFWQSLEFFHPIISKLGSMSTVLLPIPGAHNPELATPTLGLYHGGFYGPVYFKTNFKALFPAK